MKSKLLVAAALVALVAAGCNKTASQTPTTDNSQQQSGNSQGAAQPKDQSTADGASANVTTPPVDTGVSADMTATPEVVGINITSTGFSPSTVTIKKGDYVQFTNQDTAAHWPASNPHPTHTDYPGFDALKRLNTGDIYRFQFEKVGSWGFHDHLNPSTHGTVIVK